MYKLRPYSRYASINEIEKSLLKSKKLNKRAFVDEYVDKTLEQKSDEELMDAIERIASEFDLDAGKLKEQFDAVMEVLPEFLTKAGEREGELDESMESDGMKKEASLRKKAGVIDFYKKLLNPFQTIKNYYKMIKYLLGGADGWKKALALAATILISGALLLSPIDAVPDIIPILGQFDDVSLPALVFNQIIDLIDGENAQDADKDAEEKVESKRGFFEKITSFFGGGEKEGEESLPDSEASKLHILRKLSKMANKLDMEGHYKIADKFDLVIKKNS